MQRGILREGFHPGGRTVTVSRCVFIAVLLAVVLSHPYAIAQLNSKPVTDAAVPESTDDAPESKAGARTFGEFYGDPQAEATEAGGEPSLMVRYLKALGWLLIVLCLAVGTIVGLKKLRDKGANVFGGSNPRLVEVVSRTSLGPKHQLTIVRVGERALVLGIAPEGVRLLCELTEPGEVLSAQRTSFSEELANEETNYPVEEQAPENDDGLGPYRKEIERLQAMVGNWQFSQRAEGTS